jgi:ABC-type phosphate transport system substrate-binding protein
MLRPPLALALAPAAILAAEPAGLPASSKEGLGAPLAIIVNLSNPVEELSLSELRSVFLGERSHWPHGRRVTIVMRDPGQPERVAILRLVYRMGESDFTRYFLQATFTGEALSPPRRLSTSSGVRRFVFNVPGAIGYVRADEADDSVKILRVDGRAPGDPDYRLRMPSR